MQKQDARSGSENDQPAEELDEFGLPLGRQPELRMVPMPKDTNAAGDIFGGWIMSQVDVAGGIPAARVSQGRVVTVAVNSFVFKQPVSVGNLVSLYAKVIRVGATSITVDVEVYAQRWGQFGQAVKVTEAVLTYVAVDREGRPRRVSVPPKVLQSPGGE